MKNKELDLAWNFVNTTNRNIFLTGKAGTGKTTFLHKLKSESHKRLIVVAPTGVAAINAKGVTIHSFFQLPFGPILPDVRSNNSSFIRKFSKTKINMIRSLDLLIIDEISMVRADVLDGIDRTLKRYKNKKLPFGGVQVLMIGDLQQLSPVVKDDEWQLLQSHYKNAFFFSSHVYANCNPVTIELRHIYRQENPVFINILNEIRDNALCQSSADKLNKRYQPNFVVSDNEGYIYLTTHNNKANAINNKELAQLENKTKVYEATIRGDFPLHALPNDEKLALKVGAQVMFIKNDSSQEKRYFNGKIGRIIALDNDEVIVKCPGDNFTIKVTSETWENIKYTIDKDTKAISENNIGSYTQIPLRLAWAITIHKSQGLTFEKAVIDAQDAFAHGQTYVALSRCKSLEGLVLKSKITSNQIISDTQVSNFNAYNATHQPTDDTLVDSKRNYQLDLISEIFNFFEFLYPTNRILDIYYNNKTSIEGIVESQMLQLKTTITDLLKVATSFRVQLNSICDNLNTTDLPESNAQLQERFKKGLSYFKIQTETHIESALKTVNFSTDNKAVNEDINKHLDTLEELLATKQLYFSDLIHGFNTELFLKLRAKSVFLIEKQPKTKRKTIVDGTTNTDLFELLRTLRNEIAEREEKVHYQIFTQKSLYAMCELLPQTKAELKQVHGMGKTRVDKYGDEILDIIITYCTEYDIKPTADYYTLEDKKPKRQKGDSQKQSLELFKAGKSIDAIADERELNPNTIFGHLASFILTGEIKITDLISENTFSELEALIPTKTFENLSDLKQQLDDKFTYGELRLVLNHLEDNR